MLPKIIGGEGYRVIWEKLLKAKFGPYVQEVKYGMVLDKSSKKN